jgi:hypothetical protein
MCLMRRVPDVLVALLLYGATTLSHTEAATSLPQVSHFVLDKAGNADARDLRVGTWARMIVDPGLDAHIKLWDGTTLSWHFDRDGTPLSREVMGFDSVAHGMTFDAAGQLIGTYVTQPHTGTHGEDSFTEFATLHGITVRRHSVFTHSERFPSFVTDDRNACSEKCEVTVDYQVLPRGAPEVVESYSVKSTIARSTGSFTTTEIRYKRDDKSAKRLQYRQIGRVVTDTDADGKGAVSKDFDASGMLTELRRLTVPATGSGTSLTRMDADGRVQGRTSISMDHSGNIAIEAFNAGGARQSRSDLDTTGTMTVTLFDAAGISGTIANAPQIDYGNEVTYRDAKGSLTKCAWQELAGSHGTGSPLPAGGYSYTNEYPDGTKMLLKIDRLGVMTASVLNSLGTPIGIVRTTREHTEFHSHFQQVNAGASIDVDFHGDGTIEAAIARSGHSSVGVLLSDDFGYFISDNPREFRATTFDEGYVSGSVAKLVLPDGSVALTRRDLEKREIRMVRTPASADTSATTTFAGPSQSMQEVSQLISVVTANQTVATREHKNQVVQPGAAVDPVAFLVGVSVDGSPTLQTFRTNGPTIHYPNQELHLGELTGFMQLGVTGFGAVQIRTFSGVGQLDRETTLRVTGVIEDVQYITSAGRVTTIFQEDGRYERTTDNGEGQVTKKQSHLPVTDRSR